MPGARCGGADPRRMSRFFRLPLVLGVVGALVVVYALGYVLTAERDQGRARNAGVYIHYRIFRHAWQGRFFAPAAWVEAQAIRFFPRPFLSNPSWAAEPQMLLVQYPGGRIRFGNSAVPLAANP